MAAGLGGEAAGILRGDWGRARLTMFGGDWYNARQGTRTCGVFAARLGQRYQHHRRLPGKYGDSPHPRSLVAGKGGRVWRFTFVTMNRSTARSGALSVSCTSTACWKRRDASSAMRSRAINGAACKRLRSGVLAGPPGGAEIANRAVKRAATWLAAALPRPSEGRPL